MERDRHRMCQLFAGYLNNKMTLLLFLIQTRMRRPNPKVLEMSGRFLDDLFCYMLERQLQKRYRLAFRWLKLFFARLPDVRPEQRRKAENFIRAIYDAVGMRQAPDLAGGEFRENSGKTI